MKTETVKSIHLIGIGGAAMAPLAGMLAERGYHVSGADTGVFPPASTLLKSLGIRWSDGFSEKNLTPAPDLVVIGNAVSRGNVEVEFVLDQKIAYRSLPEVLQEFFLPGHESIVVSGTHGKTTTTSMLAWIFESAGRTPDFLIGGMAQNFGKSYGLGGGSEFIIEGDEYDSAFFDKGPKFLHYRPDNLIITSLEFDHADIYADLAAIELQFRRLVNLIPRRGRIVAWGESPAVRGVTAQAFCPVETYGFGPENEWVASDSEFKDEATHFSVMLKGAEQARITLPMAGRHNVLNALAAFAIAAGRGISRDAIAAGLAAFKGVARRMQVRGEVAGVTIVDDFAHHPTAIRATIEGARSRWPGRRLWVAFEPRSNTMRRRIFENDLADALATADGAVLGAVNRANLLGDAERLSPERVVQRIGASGGRGYALDSAGEIADLLAVELHAGDVILVLSNGSFDALCDKLMARLAAGRVPAQGSPHARPMMRAFTRTLMRPVTHPTTRSMTPDGTRDVHNLPYIFFHHSPLMPQRLSQPLRSVRGALLVALIACACLFSGATRARATIRYEVSLARPAAHQFQVTMTVPDVHGNIVLQMPAWNTLYEIRDFGYRVTNLRATADNGEAQTVTRLDKQTWRIAATAGAGAVRVQYSDYWDEAGPFATQLNPEHASINLAMILCYVPERRSENTTVEFTDVPANWRIALELPKTDTSSANRAAFAAPGYDALVDAPIEIGQFDEFAFQAAGKNIRVMIHGDALDHARVTQELSQIVEYETRLLGDAPFPEYLFLFHVGRNYGGGGMEHANSTTISVPSSSAMLNVSAHEFFHLWNVKRIRPQSLEPVDYTREMWTPALWFAEGVTNTYASYTLVRTGLWTKAQFYADLSEQITELETRPAHRWQSAEESSRDAWLEKYPLYDRPEFSISYYNKGQLLGLTLDILIRDATENRASLDDVLRRMNREYAQRGLFYPDSAGVRTAIEQTIREADAGAKADVDGFFARYVAGTAEIPFAELLAKAGLVINARGQKLSSLGFTATRNAAGAAVVSDVDLQSPAASAGIREGDVVEALDGSDAPRTMVRWLRMHQPGDTVHARVRHAGTTSDVTFALVEESTHLYEVSEIPQPTAKQLAIRNGLLKGSPGPAVGR